MQPGIRDEVRLIETANWSGYSNVIWHDYFGSQKVIQDLSTLPGWMDGHIQVQKKKIKDVMWKFEPDEVVFVGCSCCLVAWFAMRLLAVFLLSNPRQSSNRKWQPSKDLPDLGLLCTKGDINLS
jgi:hypothetical protein